MALVILSKYELNSILADHHIYTGDLWDESYCLTTRDFLLNEALPAYHQDVERFFRKPFHDIYVPDNFDCDNFTFDFKGFTSRLHRKYHPTVHASLAVGVGKHRMLKHSLIVVVIQVRKGVYDVCILEAQKTGTLADVSASVSYGGFSSVLYY